MWKCTLECLPHDAAHYGHSSECSTCASHYTHETAAYFASPDLFVGHVRAIHAHHITDWTENDLSTLTDSSLVQTMQEPNLCPVCYLIPEDLQSSGPRSLDNHIAEHLQLLMLWSLRFIQVLSGPSYDNEDERSLSSAAVEESGSNTGEDHSNEGSATEESLSPFTSPVLLPSSPAAGGNEAISGDEQDSWLKVTDRVCEQKRGELVDDLDQVLDHFKNTQKPRACWNVPFARNSRFVGRDAQLDQLESILFSTVIVARMAIIGLGGIGKTQLVVEMAYRIRENYSDCSILWIRADPEGLEDSIVEIWQQLRIPEIQGEMASQNKLVYIFRYLSLESAGRWLLILDGLDDVEFWRSELEEYLPKSQQGRIICTTRSRNIVDEIDASTIVQLEKLDMVPAMELLENSLTNREATSDQQSTKKLLETLHCYPLAIAQAANYINSTGVTISDYLSAFEAQELQTNVLIEDSKLGAPISLEPFNQTEQVGFQRIPQILGETITADMKESLDVDEIMSKWFGPASAVLMTDRTSFSETDLRNMSEILRRSGKESWSLVPRIYATLRAIDRVPLIQDFLDSGISDVWFPFSTRTLPNSLKPPTVRKQFLEAQQLVLSKALELEKDDGRHQYFSNTADVPFVKIAELGRGGSAAVDRVRSTISHKEYARRRIPRGWTYHRDKDVLRDFERQLAVLKKLSHRHIVELVGSYTDPRFVFTAAYPRLCNSFVRFVGMIVSPVADCNLKEFLDRDYSPSDDRVFLQTVFGCLTVALNYLHENKIHHKNIKPQVRSFNTS